MTDWIKKKKKPKTRGGRMGKAGKTEDFEISPVIVIESSEDGPKVRNKKMVTDNMGNVEFKAKGGRVKLALRGGGRAYNKNS
jgi:hypothetical protein